MKESAGKSHAHGYWESPEAVEKYSATPFLFRGERTAFATCFPDGLAGRSVLDLGCGGGRTTTFLDRLGAQVTGMDLSQNLIRSARRQHPHVSFCVGNGQALPYPDASFDVVLFSFNGLDFLYPKSSRIRCIEEVRRVLRPMGYFILSHHNLAGLLFGWYKSMRPRKLRFRFSQVINGNAFKKECYIKEAESGEEQIYWTWPSVFIDEMEKEGFESKCIFSNTISLDLVRRLLGTSWPTRLADPWPYYVLVRRPD